MTKRTVVCFQLRCVLCSQQFHVVVNELPTNFALQNVIEELRQSSEELCQACHEDRKLEVATARCLNCCKTLCFLCAEKHAKEHDLKSLSDEKCDKHQKPFELHCFACKTNLCVQCFSKDHRQHERGLISKEPERLAVIAKTEQARKTDDTEQPGSGEGVVIIPQQINGNYSTTCVFSHTSRNAKISLAPLLKHVQNSFRPRACQAKCMLRCSAVQ